MFSVNYCYIHTTGHIKNSIRSRRVKKVKRKKVIEGFIVYCRFFLLLTTFTVVQFLCYDVCNRRKNAFLPISLPVLATRSARLHGKKLFQAGHVVSCEEKGSTDGKNRVIVGAVVRQTSVNEAPVQLKMYLSEERNAREAICSCPAGESGMCKHVLAIVYHCNSAATESRTSQPQRWGKPAVKTAGKQKYAKGKRAELLFKNSKSWKTENIEPIPLPQFDVVPQSSIFAKMLKSEQTSAADRNVISDVSQILEDTITLVEQASLGEIVRNCLSLKHPIYSLANL